MDELSIRVKGIGKKYRIGEMNASYNTFRDAITNIATTPFKRFTSGSTVTDKNDFWALKNVSFDVNKGEVLGIIGRNGAGKSTLLKVLSKITEPTEGRAELYGRVGSLLEVGTGFHMELTGRENIFLSGSMLGMKKSEIAAKFDDIVKFAETDKFLDTPLKHYSSGMQVRLGFAVAAFLEPEILIIDEVLAVGDAEFQKKCLGKIEDVSRTGRTVLFVSHNMEAVERLCNRIIHLENGVVKQDSTDPQEVIHNYLYGNTNEITSGEWINTLDQFKNNWIKPVKCYITNKDSKKQTVFSNDSDAWINIELEVKNIDPGLTIGYAIYNEDGHLLYWSYHSDTSQENWPLLKKGLATLKSKIPDHLFNEGVYRIELIASLHNRQWLLQPGVTSPSIYFIVQGGLSKSPLWMSKRPGILAPVIQWDIQYE